MLVNHDFDFDKSNGFSIVFAQWIVVYTIHWYKTLYNSSAQILVNEQSKV